MVGYDFDPLSCFLCIIQMDQSKNEKMSFFTLLVKRAFFHIFEINSHFFILQSGDNIPSITLGQKNIF